MWKKLLPAVLLLFTIGCSHDITVAEPAAEPQPTPSDAIVRPSTPDEDTYANPVIGAFDRGTWNGGTGDPFVLRYNGRYYLYHSSSGSANGVKCWTSDDLAHWTYVGLCSTEPIAYAAFAPEVVYYNGSFYMYTSPGGNGHYVLRSDSPTGPFTVVTGNLGLEIDGHVFIDDNGNWFFYCADIRGIRCYRMASPTEVLEDVTTLTGAYMNGWTEGPMVIRYGDHYFITYTGNHVLCNGYRIHYATSPKAPILFTPAENNPILINTDPANAVGLGHSSTVLAPDLDGYYIVYHAYEVLGYRDTRIDRLYFNGDYMAALGPTYSTQSVAAMPDLYHRFEDASLTDGWQFHKAEIGNGRLTVKAGGLAVSDTVLYDRFTMECNLLSLTGTAGALFHYRDRDNYAAALYDGMTGTLRVTFTENGETTVHEAAVTACFADGLYRTDALINLTVRKYGDAYTFFVNGREILRCESSMNGGGFGLTSVSGKAEFGFFGVSGDSMQSALKDFAKPVPGLLPANTCLEERLSSVTYGAVEYVRIRAGEVYNYKSNAVGGTADSSVLYRAAANAVLSVLWDGRELGTLSLAATPDGTNGSAILRGFSLPEGYGTLSIRVISGEADVFSYTVHAGTTDSPAITDLSAPTFRNGTWQADGDVLYGDGYGKILYGTAGWGDYALEARITVTAKNEQGNTDLGLLLRASAPSDAGVGKTDRVAANFVCGYGVRLADGAVVLEKLSYAQTEICRVRCDVTTGVEYLLRAEAAGSTIRVFLDGELLIEYSDPSPYVSGMAGFILRGGTGEIRAAHVLPASDRAD